MDTSLDTLKIKKKNSNDIKDLNTDFGIYLVSMPPLVATEAKDPATQDWLDEDGVDVYDADRVYLKAFDIDIKMGVKGIDSHSCHSRFTDFLRYLTCRGTLHTIYAPHVCAGRTGVRFVSVSDIEFDRASDETFMTWTMKMNVSDPVSEVDENLAVTTINLD